MGPETLFLSKETYKGTEAKYRMLHPAPLYDIISKGKIVLRLCRALHVYRITLADWSAKYAI